MPYAKRKFPNFVTEIPSSGSFRLCWWFFPKEKFNNNGGEGAGVMFELDSVSDTEQLLRAGGWTLLTGVNLMLFSLLHNPCSTTIYTIYKETKSAKWTAVASLLPLVIGFVVTFFVAQIWRLIAGF